MSLCQHIHRSRYGFRDIPRFMSVMYVVYSVVWRRWCGYASSNLATMRRSQIAWCWNIRVTLSRCCSAIVISSAVVIFLSDKLCIRESRRCSRMGLH